MGERGRERGIDREVRDHWKEREGEIKREGELADECSAGGVMVDREGGIEGREGGCLIS